MTPEQMQKRLEETYPGDPVQVIDLTGNNSNYQVVIQSAAFQGKSRIQQHKEVMAVFDAELKSGEVHALTIKTVAKES